MKVDSRSDEARGGREEGVRKREHRMDQMQLKVGQEGEGPWTEVRRERVRVGIEILVGTNERKTRHNPSILLQAPTKTRNRAYKY